MSNTTLLEVAKILLPFVGVVITVGISHYNLKKNIKRESQERISRYKMDKMYDAGLGFWQLLAYTTLVENTKAIFIWEKAKSGGTTYYLCRANAVEFLQQLSVVNYERGCGLFMSKEVRQLFYEYRGLVYKVLQANSNTTVERIKIENEELINRCKGLHDDMVLQIRASLELRGNIVIEKVD